MAPALRLERSDASRCAQARACDDLRRGWPRRYACTAPSCGKSYADYQSYANHCATQGHPINYTVCAGCGRIGELVA
jgi:hypothetical protein